MPKSRAAYRRRWNALPGHREQLADSYQQRRKANQERAMDYLGGKCHDCPITDRRVLQFDHVEKKTHAISYLLGGSWPRILRELVKCELVCANCHVIRSQERGQHTRAKNRSV